MISIPLRCTLVLALFAAVRLASASNITVQVVDINGAPVPNAAVYVEAGAGQALPKSLKQVEIEQRNVKFLPLVTVVQTGTPVLFPNHDTVRHHVYSFSTPKVFEIKLYSGVPGSPVLFDKPGTVVLGCNIHDEMVAYIQVVNTPYFTKTDATGVARLPDVPEGKYRLKTWYFKMQGDPALDQPLEVKSSEAGATVKLTTKVAL